MNVYLFLQKFEVKNNPKVKRALETFDAAQEVYEKATKAMTIRRRESYGGSYSSNLSKKDYYANISTTTRRTK